MHQEVGPLKYFIIFVINSIGILPLIGSGAPALKANTSVLGYSGTNVSSESQQMSAVLHH